MKNVITAMMLNVSNNEAIFQSFAFVLDEEMCNKNDDVSSKRVSVKQKDNLWSCERQTSLSQQDHQVHELIGDKDHKVYDARRLVFIRLLLLPTLFVIIIAFSTTHNDVSDYEPRNFKNKKNDSKPLIVTEKFAQPRNQEKQRETQF